jgi:hypothetical protein
VCRRPLSLPAGISPGESDLEHSLPLHLDATRFSGRPPRRPAHGLPD